MCTDSNIFKLLSTEVSHIFVSTLKTEILYPSTGISVQNLNKSG